MRTVNQHKLGALAMITSLGVWVGAGGSARAAGGESFPRCGDGLGSGIAYRTSETFAAPAEGASVFTLSNGLAVTVYGADDLARSLTYLDGEPIIPLDENRYISVITDVEDPVIYNKGDGEFHPFDEARVTNVLEQITHPRIRTGVTVYILPFPRRTLLVSSTSGTEVFLSPHVLDIHAEVSAYIVTHELGHVFHNRYLENYGSKAWADYRFARGITDPSVFSEESIHAYKPSEIFAEDFRVLFGGPDAQFGGNIENPELESPVHVLGLRDFFLSFAEPDSERQKLVATSFPNPFNPVTAISLRLSGEVLRGGERVSVRIYNVRGALVRDLYTGVPSSDQLTVSWDGRDNRGNEVASANYFARVQSRSFATTVKLVMIK